MNSVLPVGGSDSLIEADQEAVCRIDSDILKSQQYGHPPTLLEPAQAARVRELGVMATRKGSSNMRHSCRRAPYNTRPTSLPKLRDKLSSHHTHPT